MAHLKSKHIFSPNSLEETVIEHILKEKLRWKIEGAQLKEDTPKFRRVWRCMCKECKYLSNTSSSLACHVRNVHQDVEALRHKVGLFWALNITHAIKYNKLLKVNDLIKNTKACICDRCELCFGKDRNTVTLHSKKVHPECNIRGNNVESRYCVLTPFFFEEGNDEMVNLADEELNKEKAMIKEQQERMGSERQRSWVRPTNETQNNNSTDNDEDHDGVDVNNGSQTNEVINEQVNILNEEEWLNGPRQEGEATDNSNQDVHNNGQNKRKDKRNKKGSNLPTLSLNNMMSLQSRLEKARRWIDECMEEDDNLSHIPKI